ncbi:hypothetical protein GCM10009799_41020 [Nocardiopsis rhodophaea]|uniref:Uncharacterized protein n=1 Tax=Nocardiopsis rhodophaea TaxID=280238 RepID=A0ABN2TGU1_9ACTN
MWTYDAPCSTTRRAGRPAVAVVAQHHDFLVEAGQGPAVLGGAASAALGRKKLRDEENGFPGNVEVAR